MRGRFGLEFVGKGRIHRPLIRKNGRLVEVSWNEALDYAAKGLARFRGGRFALFTSGILTNEALYMAKKFATVAMGADAVAEDVSSLDFRPEDLQGPMVVVGDLSRTNPATELAIRSKKPVVVSSQSTLLAKLAGLWLRADAGNEHLVLASLAEALKGMPGSAAKALPEKIVQAARMLPGGTVIAGPDCSAKVRAAAGDLALAMNGRLVLVGKNCNSRGASALGLNTKYQQTLKALTSDKLEAAYIVGLNPVRADPKLAEHLSRLDFLVVQDLFLTETAALADVIFPAASFAEIEGTILGPAGKTLPLRRAMPPTGRPDWQILAELGRKMGAEGFEFTDSKAVTKDMLAAIDVGQVVLSPGSFVAREQAEDSPPAVASLFQFGSGTRTSRVSDLEYLTRKQVR